MHRFQGVKVTRKRFWELAGLGKDLEVLAKELDKEIKKNRKKNFVFELVTELEKQELQKNQIQNQEKKIIQNFCSSKRHFRKNSFRKSIRNSDFEDFENALIE